MNNSRISFRVFIEYEITKFCLIESEARVEVDRLTTVLIKLLVPTPMRLSLIYPSPIPHDTSAMHIFEWIKHYFC